MLNSEFLLTSAGAVESRRMNDLFKEFVKIEAPQSEVSFFALMGVVETRSRGGG